MTRNQIAQAYMKLHPEVKGLELVRGHEGYFYCVGEWGNGRPFVTSGIYVYRLHAFDLDRWLVEMHDVISDLVDYPLADAS